MNKTRKNILSSETFSRVYEVKFVELFFVPQIAATETSGRRVVGKKWSYLFVSSFVPFSVVNEAQEALHKVNSSQHQDKRGNNKDCTETLVTGLQNTMSEMIKEMREMKITLEQVSKEVVNNKKMEKAND